MKLGYNTPLIVERSTSTLTSQGARNVWKRERVVLASLRHMSERTKPEDHSPVEIDLVYIVATRDPVEMTEGLQYYRYLADDKILFPKTYFRHNGKEYVMQALEEEDAHDG